MVIWYSSLSSYKGMCARYLDDQISQASEEKWTIGWPCSKS